MAHRCSQRMVRYTMLVKDLQQSRCIRDGSRLSAVIRVGGSHTCRCFWLLTLLDSFSTCNRCGCKDCHSNSSCLRGLWLCLSRKKKKSFYSHLPPSRSSVSLLNFNSLSCSHSIFGFSVIRYFLCGGCKWTCHLPSIRQNCRNSQELVEFALVIVLPKLWNPEGVFIEVRCSSFCIHWKYSIK